MRKYYFLILFLILFLGFVLRFYRLGEIPAGLHKDEAFLGYNAYSILKTGKDMSGNLFPLHLASFIYTPAGYSYLSIPFIEIFGLNEFSIRFPSALFGFLTIIITYLLVKKIFRDEKNIKVELLSIFSSFLLAISPWNINLARTASVITVVVFFVTLGTLFYLLWLEKDKRFYLLISFLSFFASLFFYIAPYSFLPLFVPLIIFIFTSRQKLIKYKFHLAFLYITFILLPLFLTLSSKELSLRARSLSIAHNEGTNLVLEEQIRGDGINVTLNRVTRFFHNKPMSYFYQFNENYFEHLSFDFLFTDKAFPDRYRVPLTGPLYLFELPLLVLGLYGLLRLNKKNSYFLLVWVLLAPIGSAMTFDDIPNLQRTLIIFPALSIISAYGLIYLVSFKNEAPRPYGRGVFSLLLRRERNPSEAETSSHSSAGLRPRFSAKGDKFKIVNSLLVLVILIGIYNFVFYLHQYYIHFPRYRPWYRNDGYKELVLGINVNISSYKKAIITNRESAPTIFFLFYGKYDPSQFQKDTKNSVMKDLDRIAFSKYEFSTDECPVDPAKPILKENIIYVNSGLCKEVGNAKIIRQVRRADNSLVFTILSK